MCVGGCVCDDKTVPLTSVVTPIVGLGMVVVVFGYLLSIFRMKYGGYPYRFVSYHPIREVVLIFLVAL